MFSRSAFISANRFLLDEKDFKLRNRGDKSLYQPVLISGPKGFDAEGFAKCFWASAEKRSRPFVMEHSLIFKTKIQIKEAMSAAVFGDFYLQGLEQLKPNIIRSMEELIYFGIKNRVRFIGSFNISQKLDECCLLRLGSCLYGLNVATIKVPALSNRTHDIAECLRFYSNGRIKLSEAELNILKNHQWSGEAEELKKFVFYYDLFRKNNQEIFIDEKFLKDIASKDAAQLEARLFNSLINEEDLFKMCKFIGYQKTKKLTEASLLRHALNCSGGQKSLAARKLGLGPVTLNNRLQALTGYL